MFDNIGNKIKTVAKVVAWIGIIASIIVGLVMLIQDKDTAFAGVLIMIFGSLFSWIGSFMTYGFGQLIENTDILVKQGNKEPSFSRLNTSSNTCTSTGGIDAHQWRCEGCGDMISDDICPNCGKATGNMADKIKILNKWRKDDLIAEEDEL